MTRPSIVLAYIVVLLAILVGAVALGHAGIDVGINGTHWIAGDMLGRAP